MKVYVENKDKMTSYQWGYDEESKRYFIKLNFDLPSDAKVKVLSLADYTKQVRKETIEQIKDYMENHSHAIPVNTKNRKVVYKIGLTRFLDKMQELEQDNK